MKDKINNNILNNYMDKEIHIWLDNNYNSNITYTTYIETLNALKTQNIIHTTQLHFCSFSYNRRIFIHFKNEIHEITLGQCEGTKRLIKEGYNIEKLLIAGEFSWF